MSLLLSWETPAELYDTLRAVSRAAISRQTPMVTGDSPITVVNNQVSCGFYEDTGNNDPAMVYTIDYLRPGNSGSVLKICDDAIRRWVRPADTCRIDFEFRRPDSSPWHARRFKIFDIPGQGWVRDMWCDPNGKAHVVLSWGQRVRIEVEGMAQALELAVPHLQQVNFFDLNSYGTWLRVDERAIR